LLINPAQGCAAVTRRLRNVVWRELPFSARRGLIGVVRTLDRWEGRVHRFWRSLIDSLDDSPAWLFVAIVGTIGVVLTILLFLSLTQEALAARSSFGFGQRVIEPAGLSSGPANELDSRLCLVAPPLKPQPYPAEFDFSGIMLANEPVRQSWPLPTPQDDFPAWGDLPEVPPRRETKTLTSRPTVSLPENTGRPDLVWLVDWSHRGGDRRLAAVTPTEVSARSAMQDGESHTRLAVLGGADRDGWSWFRERFGRIEIPPAYTGDGAPPHSVDEDLSAMDFTAVASRAAVAFDVELHAPERVNLHQPGRSHLVIRNAGGDTIRRLELREPTQPLELITAADPPAALADGVLLREVRNLRRGRDRELGMEWFPQSTGRRSVGAQIIGEAMVAALVQVEREPEQVEPEPQPVNSAPPLPRRQPAVESEPEPVPEPAPIRRPPRKPTRVIPSMPGLDCQVRTAGWVAMRAVTELSIDVRNTGDADLQDVRIWVTLPANLAHRQGPRLEYVVGDLPAGKTHPARLRVVGAQPGSAVARVLAFAGDETKSEAAATLDVTGLPAVEPRRPVGPGCPCGPQMTWIAP
jgi:hypothetical protein